MGSYRRSPLNNFSSFLPLLKLILDIILYNLSLFFALLMKFDAGLDAINFISRSIIFAGISLIFKLPYQNFRFVDVNDFVLIFFSLAISETISYLVSILVKSPYSINLSFISFLFSVVLITGIRAIFKIIYDLNRSRRIELFEKPKKIVIVGAGEAGERLLKEMLFHSKMNYKIIGFLDDDPSKHNTRIHGVRVVGRIDDLPEIIKKYGIDTVIYAIPSAPKELLRKVISLASSSSVEVKSIPSLLDIIRGKVRISDIKDISLKDLLPRKSIDMDNKKVREYIKGKIVLITGAGGSIGSEIVRQIVNFNPGRIILLGKGENRIFNIEREAKERLKFKETVPIICDIRNREKVFAIFEKYKPDVVFHTAAHKHVPLMERNPDEAVLNNIFGTKNLLDAALKFGLERFVNISTDKAVNPVSVMGATKRVVEIMVQYYSKEAKNSLFTSVRFGNVLGTKGSVLEVFKDQIKTTGVITITDPRMERYFMLLNEAVELVLQAGAMGKGGEIFILKVGEAINIMDFAKNFVKLSGLTLGKDVKIRVIGNRGGEKIKEELWSNREKVVETENPYILKIVDDIARYGDRERFFKGLELLKNVALKMDSNKIKLYLKKLVPEYVYYEE